MSVQTLQDERAIVRGLNGFARLADTRDWTSVPNVFSSDLTFDYGGGEQGGIDALTGLFTQFLGTCGPSQHLLGSIEVEVKVDEAVSLAYVQARHQGGYLFYDTNGEYRDCWRREKAGWRIVHRKVKMDGRLGGSCGLGPVAPVVCPDDSMLIRQEYVRNLSGEPSSKGKIHVSYSLLLGARHHRRFGVDFLVVQLEGATNAYHS